MNNMALWWYGGKLWLNVHLQQLGPGEHSWAAEGSIGPIQSRRALHSTCALAWHNASRSISPKTIQHTSTGDSRVAQGSW